MEILIHATLPPRENYTAIETQGTRFKWYDSLERNIKVISPVEEPWGKCWAIAVHLNQNRGGNGERYIKELNFQLLEPVEVATHEIEITEIHANFAYGSACEFFAAFRLQASEWLIYEIKKAP